MHKTAALEHKTLPMGDKLLITKTINVGVYRCSSVINK